MPLLNNPPFLYRFNMPPIFYAILPCIFNLLKIFFSFTDLSVLAPVSQYLISTRAYPLTIILPPLIFWGVLYTYLLSYEAYLA